MVRPLLLRHWLLTGAVAALCLSATLLLFTTLRHQENVQADSHFELEGKALGALIQSRLHEHEETLDALQRLYAASNTVTIDEFHTFVQPTLDRHADIAAFAWIPRITDAHRMEHEANARELGLDNYVIVERSDTGDFRPAATRGIYYPLWYVVPASPNRMAYGRDWGANSILSGALEKATDLRQAVAVTRPGVFDGEAGDTIVLVAPVYNPGVSLDTVMARREALQGFVAVVFKVGSLISASIAHSAGRGLDIAVFERSNKGEDALLYSNRPTGTPHDRNLPLNDGPFVETTFDVNIADRQWSVVYRLSRAEALGYYDDATWWVLAIGLCGTVVAGWFVLYSRLQIANREIQIRQRTAQLSASETRSRAVLDTMIDALIVIDDKGIIEQANPAAEHLFGYPRNEIVGQNVAMLMPEEYSRHHDGYIKDYICSGQRKVIGIGREVVAQHRSGAVFPVELSVGEMRIENQRRFTGIVRDISDRVAAQTQLRGLSLRLSLAVESARLGIWDWDIGSGSLTWDKRMYEMYEMDPNNTPTNYEHWREKIHHDDLNQIETVLHSSIATGGRFEAEFRVVRRDGSWRYIKAWGQGVRGDNGQVARLVGINYDISDRREAEIELRTAKEAAESANHAKSLFLANMSHELRTPVNVLLGFAQLLELTATDSDREHVQEILVAGRHLTDLINEILDLSAIEVGQANLTIEAVDVHEVLDECLALVSPMAEQRRVQAQRDRVTNMTVWADRTRLKQVLLNYLSNGIKYNREGGRLEAGLEPVAADRCRIYVRDTGTGVTAIQRSLLFKPFSRLEQHVNEVSGTGIGLAISKRLAEQMGGCVGVDSEVGVGSTFWLELPTAVNTESRREAPASANPRSPTTEEDAWETPATVLCIEDNSANLRLITRLLAGFPAIRLLTATEPVVGLELATTQRPDLILLDINLPGMDGFEVMARIRANPELGRTPVIAITAQAMKEHRERAEAAGFTDYLTKPLDVKEFRQAIKDALATLETHTSQPA